MLEDAKLDLEAKKDLYYSVTTGLSAVTSAMKAFKGDDELNQDAEKALAILKQQIGEKIGHIKSAIDVTSRFMDDKVLEDKAKSAQAIELINHFDLNTDFNYTNNALQNNSNREAERCEHHRQVQGAAGLNEINNQNGQMNTSR